MAQSRACQLLDFLMRQLLPIITVLLLAGCESTPLPGSIVIDKTSNTVKYAMPALFDNRRAVLRTLESVDAASYQSLEHDYSKDKNYVFHFNQTMPFADAASFQVLSKHYSMDKNRLYYQGSPIPGAVPKNIKILKENTFSSSYVLSNGIVYLDEGEISFQPCDVKSIKVMLKPHFVKDSQCVFHLGKKLAGANPDKFITFNNNYGKDKTQVFFQHQAIAKVDIASFDVESQYYATDKNHAYFEDKIMPGVSAIWLDADFDGGEHATDKTSVYYRGKKIPGADRKSFSVLNWSGLGRDKQQCYQETQAVDCVSRQPKTALAEQPPEHKTKADPAQPEAPASVYSGVDLTKITDERSANAAVSQMLVNLLAIQKSSNDKLLQQLPEFISAVKNKFADQLLTPELVSQIDLTQLPAGFHYKLQDPSPLGQSYMVEFKGINNNIAHFLRHQSNVYGVMPEQRTLNGQVLLRSTPFSKVGQTKRYQPAECLFQLGHCQSVSYKSDNTSSNSQDVHIRFEDGVWYHDNPKNADSYDIYLFDKYGFILLKARIIDKELLDILLRF